MLLKKRSKIRRKKKKVKLPVNGVELPPPSLKSQLPKLTAAERGPHYCLSQELRAYPQGHESIAWNGEAKLTQK